MQSDNGEIEVFLCPEEELNGIPSCSSEDSATDTESEASPFKTLVPDARMTLPSPPPRLDLDEESRSSDISGQIRNALISASEDFGPMGNRLQLQTLDQDNSKFFNCCVHVYTILDKEDVLSHGPVIVMQSIVLHVYHSSSTVSPDA